MNNLLKTYKTLESTLGLISIESLVYMFCGYTLCGTFTVVNMSEI
jgi:hypothetical protein